MGEVFTIPEVAAKLKMHVKRAYKLTKMGIIPAVKIGKSWRVSEENLKRLLDGASESEVKAA